MSIYRNKTSGYFSNVKNDQFTELFNGEFKIGDQVILERSGEEVTIDYFGDGHMVDLHNGDVCLTCDITPHILEGQEAMIYRNLETGYFSNVKDDQFTELFDGKFKKGDKVLHTDTNKELTVQSVNSNLTRDLTFEGEGGGWVYTLGVTPHITGPQEAQQTTDLHKPGAKDDANKPLPQVVLGGFANALQGVTEVGTSGARKYSRDGWKSVPDAEDRYMGALLRHLLDHMAGSTIDQDSGFSQLRHIAWNALALCELDENNE